MSGARHDAPSVPHDALLLARRGMAQCLRLLDQLPDHALELQDRRRLIAQLSYDARDLALAFAALRQDGDPPVIDDPARRLAYGVSLPAHALRYLFQHTAIHLDVEWRDLQGPKWDQPVPGFPDLLARACPMQRAVLLWQGSVRLGGRVRDIPASVGGQVTAART